MDAAVCVWEPDPESGIWSPSARLGLLKEDSLGVHGCVWGPSGTSSILAHSLQGSLHRWDQVCFMNLQEVNERKNENRLHNIL